MKTTSKFLNKLRRNLSDAQLIERAEQAGWVWRVNHKCWAGNITGWEVTDCHIQNCSIDGKANTLKGTDEHLGFSHDLTCRECRKPIWLMWCSDEELIERMECFNCNFWLRLIRKGTGVVTEKETGERTHHMIGEEKKPGPWNGYGGQEFTIRFKDGRVVKTCNLWHQGSIPERFWDRLPVNAEFVYGERK